MHPEDLKVGKWYVVTKGPMVIQPAQASAFGILEEREVEYKGNNGIPFQVKAISLPYILVLTYTCPPNVSKPNIYTKFVERTTLIDVRDNQFAAITPHFAKTFKEHFCQSDKPISEYDSLNIERSMLEKDGFFSNKTTQ